MTLYPTNITIARESRGYTQKELSDLLGIQQGTLSKLEKGIIDSTDHFIENISEALNYPLDFFYQEPLIRVAGYFRTKLTLSEKISKANIAKMTVIERHFTTLHEAVDLPVPNIPQWDLDIAQDGGTPEMASSFVRNNWRVPKGRIPNLVELLEDNGIVVIGLNLSGMDAFSTYSETGYPLIFFNKNMPSDRQRFNLAHELGHLVMHWGAKGIKDKTYKELESEAHKFASEFLMPTKDILPFLDKLNLAKLGDLKLYWKASMASIATKAKDLEMLTKDQYYYLMKHFSINKYKTYGEPELFPAEQPTLIKEIVDIYISRLDYSIEDLSKLLKTDSEEISEIYYGRPSLKNTTFKLRYGT